MTTLSNEFTRRVTALNDRAKAVGTNMTRVCKTSGLVSRATFERWCEVPPQNVRALDALEAEVARLEAEAAAAARTNAA